MNKLMNDVERQIAAHLSTQNLASLRATKKSMQNFGKFHIKEDDKVNILQKLYDRVSRVDRSYNEKKFYVDLLLCVQILYDHCQISGTNENTIKNARSLYNKYIRDIQKIMNAIPHILIRDLTVRTLRLLFEKLFKLQDRKSVV